MAVPVLAPLVGGVVREGLKRYIAPAVANGIGYVVRRAFNGEGRNIIAPPRIEMPPPVNNAGYAGGGLLSRLDKQNELLEHLIRNYQLSNLLKIASDEQLGEIAVQAIGQEVVDPNKKGVPAPAVKDKFEQLLDALNENLKKSNEIIEEQSKTIKEIKDSKLKEIDELRGIGQKKIDFDPITKSINELKSIGLNATVENKLKIANEVNIKKLEVSNEVVVKKLNAELDITKPVDIKFPEKVVEYQDKMLEQKIKEVEILDERAKFDKTPLSIKDLDGQAVASASPREMAAQYHAVKAKNATDEKNFELSDGDIDDLFGGLPDITGIFKFKLPGDIDKEFSKGG